jgi:hypothetical protein
VGPGDAGGNDFARPRQAAIAYNTGQYNLIMQPGGFAPLDRNRNAWAPW